MTKINPKIVLIACLFVSACSTTQDKKTVGVPEKKVAQREEQRTIRIEGSSDISDEKQLSLEAKLEKEEIYKDKEGISGSSKLSKNLDGLNKTYYLYGAEHLNLDNYYFDFPVVYNDEVKKWMSYFLKKGREYFERYSERAGSYAPILGKILEYNHLPRDLIFLAMAESGFNTQAKSWAKAVGPWQFMPYTGSHYGLRIDPYMDERKDPIKSTVAACRYLQKLFNDFGSWEIAAAAYNAGEGKMNEAIRRYKTENFWEITRGSYLKPETKNYVPKIMALAIIGKNLKTFEFEDIEFKDPLDFDEIEVTKLTDLYTVAEKLDVEFEELKRLNPELSLWFTSPKIEKYKLRVPPGYHKRWESCCEKMDLTAKNFLTYEVNKKPLSILQLSKKYKVDPRIVADFNNMSVNSKISHGMKVVLPIRTDHSLEESAIDALAMSSERDDVEFSKFSKSDAKEFKIVGKRHKTKKEKKAKKVYLVKKGDTLYRVAKVHGMSVRSLIVANYSILGKRRLRPGDRIFVK